MSEERTVTEADLQAYADGRLAEARLPQGEQGGPPAPPVRRAGAGPRVAGGGARGEPVPQRLERAARRRWRWRTAAAAAGLVALGGLIGVLGGRALHEGRGGGGG